jgi:hypothetical protein
MPRPARVAHLRLVPRPPSHGLGAWLAGVQRYARAHPRRTVALVIGLGWLLGRALRKP